MSSSVNIPEGECNRFVFVTHLKNEQQISSPNNLACCYPLHLVHLGPGGGGGGLGGEDGSIWVNAPRAAHHLQALVLQTVL